MSSLELIVKDLEDERQAARYAADSLIRTRNSGARIAELGYQRDLLASLDRMGSVIASLREELDL